MRSLNDLPPDQRAELRRTPMADLEGELEWVGCSAADLEERIGAGAEDETELACWGLILEQRGALAKAEIERRLRLKQPLRGPVYSRQFVLDLKARIDLPELIVSMHAGTHLKRAGNHMVGLCPYHADNSASLHVWTDHYHCFGCQEHGDCFDWLMKMAVRNWREAVEYVAKWVGVPLPKQGAPGTVLGAYER